MDSLWWFVGAMVLGIVEVFTLDLTFAMLAGGAIAGGAAALLGLPWWVCVIIACAVSAMLLFSLRPYLLKSIRAKGAVIETNAAALAGAAARSLDEITEFAGRVKLAGEVWSARTQDDAPAIPEGAEVVVLEIRGATAIVAPEKGN
ncbi:NfeD family protein [Demequina aestuarii]|uniref:NfeD family protein n=1 Tax=Demequina aestuarii TaxID=327095 RepID=UPI000AF0E5AA|nr:NfeD family protein [Demequina aestuarii]